jgi:predicted O-methyltransferase YrrM
VDIEAFRAGLPQVFGGDLQAPHPRDRRFRRLMDDVPGMASENKLALLNFAASLLPPGEAYLEVGSFKGLSIIAAMLGNETGEFHAIESFREFGVDSSSTRRELEKNLARWRTRDRLHLMIGDSFALLRDRAAIRSPIGVYFYDGNHGRLAQHLALGIAEPLLADEALIVVDDASWPVVRTTSQAFVRRHAGYELLFDLPSEREYDPKWWNGLLVYGYRRLQGASGISPFELAWRRVAYLYGYEPATYAAGQLLSGRPRLTSAVKRVLPLSGRRVKGA